MPIGLPGTQMSADAYLAWEREQPERHEFFHGEVYAMTGGSLRHSALAAAIVGELHASMRGTDCRIHSSGQRVAVVPGAHYVYPDITVVCGKHELAAGTHDVLANPRVVIEVLSPSTEAHDRGDKWAAYRRLSSLRDYVLVSQVQPCIEVFRREDAHWIFDVAEAGDRLTLADQFILDVDAIYAGIFELPTA